MYTENLNSQEEFKNEKGENLDSEGTNESPVNPETNLSEGPPSTDSLKDDSVLPETLPDEIQDVPKDGEQGTPVSEEETTPAKLQIAGSPKSEYHLSDTPTIYQKVYDSLPGLLKKVTALFKDERERDLVLTASLVTIGACLKNVHGSYDNDKVYPNLFAFIIAPPASGKSKAKYARKLAEEADGLVRAKSEELLWAFKEGKVASEGTIKGKLKEEPQLKSLFIAGNTSSAAIITALQNNEGHAILFETEADTLTNSLKQDWGGFSDLLRKAFHSEAYSYTRKGNGGPNNSVNFHIEVPKLSVVLTGTPNQVLPLIHSQEDGLFSRFIYYAFAKQIKYRPIAQKGESGNFDQYFTKLGKSVKELYQQTKERSSIEFSITNDQLKRLNEFLECHHSKITTFLSHDAQSFIFRMGLIGYKLAMIISTVRSFEENNLSSKISCGDDDFSTVLSLLTTYLEHTITVYTKLPKKTINEAQKQATMVYEQMPGKFRRKELIDHIKDWKISERTLDYYLKQFCNMGLLEKDRHGVYHKVHF